MARSSTRRERGETPGRRRRRPAGRPPRTDVEAGVEPIELKDGEVESALKSGEHPGLLEDYFGAAQYAELRALAREAAARGVRGGDLVLILPGIMGSKLGFVRPFFFDDVIWVDPVDIALGRLAELELNGGESGVQALGVMLFAYLKLKLSLQIAGHDAQFFPFDWRLDLLELGKRLAARIKAEGRNVHLVAHSMGGLVARAALLQNPKSVGRIIMLGTPNFGSYAPIEALRGSHALAAKLAFLDVSHTKEDLARIYASFPGLCEMIPSPDKVATNFFELGSWPAGGLRPSQTMLASSRKTQGRLPTEYDDLFVVAGVDQETVVDAQVEADEFVYTRSFAGDGTVPLAFVLLPGAKRTYYVAEGHGSLPNNADVARAVDSILATGETTVLATKFEPRRAGVARRISEREIEATRPYPGNRGRALSAREKRHLLEEVAAPDERAAAVAFDGTAPPALAQPAAEAEFAVADSVVIGRRQQHRLEVTLAFGSITETQADAYVLGLFKLVPPSGAASAVNALLDGAIDQMVARRMFNANVGEISFMPTGKHPVRAEVIVFAGLGPFDGFNEDVLEIVGENLVRTFVSTRIDDFATVPIGGGSGAFTPLALQRLLRGFVRGLVDADHAHRFRGLTICETDRERFLAIQRELYRLCGTELFDGVEVTLRDVELPRLPASMTARAGAPSGVPQDVYLQVRQEAEAPTEITYVSSVLTAGSKATIYKDRQVVRKAVLDAHLAQLANGLRFAALPKFGSELARMVLSDGINRILERHASQPLIVVHDAAASRIPWETVHIGQTAPALAAGLTHRYEAEDLSIAKWLEERQEGPTLDLLLIVNPTRDLDGAEDEGDRIRSIFEKLKPSVTLRELRGNEARKNEIVKCLRSDRFDVIHYAGHAYFDPVTPSRSGILCAGREVLSGEDLKVMGSLPSLVFFNACESGRLRRLRAGGRRGKARAITGGVRETVGFAEAFLRGGIANYVGTYWPVGDEAALVFGETFYEQLLAGETLGTALMSGRKAVHALRSPDWADYVFYGDPGFVLKKRA